jgi:hypothetical protein
MGLALSGTLLVAEEAWSGGKESAASARPVLEIMSLDQGDCTLRLSWPSCAMAVNHVIFNDHRGAFTAVIQSSDKGVRVSFDGWGKEPFHASADKLRIIYSVAGKKEIDFVAEAVPDRAIRVRAIDRPVMKGRRIVIRLGERAPESAASVSVEGSSD